MSKKSYSDIEQAIKTAAEAHEPAFDEQSWKKMEALLDKDKDRKRPVIFWLWWLLPLVIGAGVAGYYIFNNPGKENVNQKIATTKNYKPVNEDVNSNSAIEPNTKTESNLNNDDLNAVPKNFNNDNNNSVVGYFPGSTNNSITKSAQTNSQTNKDEINSKRNLNDKLDGKMKTTIKAGYPSVDDETNENLSSENNPDDTKKALATKEKTEEIIVIKVDADKTPEKEIVKMIDSTVEKLKTDKRTKNRISKLYIIAVGGAEANGVKLFSADKITGRYGLGLGYELSKNLSVQTGFYVSNKKYNAAAGDYKTKPGSYWNVVDIKNIEANCKVYEIPISVIYNFTPGKKLNIIASAGLSSYIMKKEDYRFYYEHYGVPREADAHYSGNKNLFSVLRLSAGIEKKISSRLSVIASPGVAIPLSGVGDGEVKLYSTDLTIGLKFYPFKKK